MHTWKCFINRHERENAEEIGGVVLELSEQFLLHHQTATIDDGGKNCGGSLRGGVRVGVLVRRLGISCGSRADDGPQQVNLWSPLLNVTYSCNTDSDLALRFLV